jgi:putative ABC transport system permease protein
MLKNYFLIAVRNLVKNRAYSLINILGLAAGIAVTILIALFVFDELSYDQFHEKKDRIYRVSREWFNEDGTPSLHLAKVAPPIGTLVLEDYPDIIEAAVRIRKQWGALLRYEDKVFTEDRFYWAEPSFFDIFSYPMLKGDKETALNEPNSVLLTETAAAKYFGNTDPIGKTILLSTGYDSRSAQLVVTGIVKDPPENTHFHFDFLGSFKTIELLFGEEFMRKNWGRNNYSTYVLFKEENGAEILESKFPGFLDKHLAAAYKEYFGEAPEMLPSKFNKLHLMNITDIHLHSNLNSEMEPNSSITNVYLFSTIAFFVLLIACINFMNLSTARSSKRAREIGMRKVLGAYKTQLIRQFLGESFIVTFIALLLAVVAVELILPEFNGFINRNLRLLGGNQGIIFGGLLLLLIFVSLIAGSYPAFALSSFKPVKVLKGDKKANAGGVTFRTVLVVTQFVISISLIIAMGIVWQQMDYLQNKRLGINKENIVLLNADSTMIAKRKEIKTELYRNPKLNGVTFSSLVPSNALLNSWGGKKIDGEDGESLEFRLAVVEVDYDYLDTYGIELLAGRNFSPEYAADDSSSYILNETAVRKLG